MNTTRSLYMPLTLVKVPLEYLYEESSSELANNVLRWIKGVNNPLVDLGNTSHISTFPGCLSLVDHELPMFLKETMNRSNDYINEKRIMLRWVDGPAFVTMCLDREKTATILWNLLMVFTDNIDRGGEILPSASCNTQNWELRLESKGNGLLERKL